MTSIPQGIWQWLDAMLKAVNQIAEQLERQNALLERLLLHLEDAHDQATRREQVRATSSYPPNL